ncbi:hypothetical protein MAPG_08901 [Magnaporthiopsis poae ATCC 64411]|uniref:Uncharacterized protein n=1 Tax=Magnaporthiopsis poae (strain ATCC 64411 / 73-15) TaxID=644358 RepID=A0A0C4E8J2_MAGP6|nr:hypothetical protein MAPG_08901 [Magnaporthiopsis poae ATCC 64411]
MFADKRQWGPDEFEQVRALEEALDEAKRDFQAMSRLVSGQFFYERDRNSKSVEELRNLNTRLSFHRPNAIGMLSPGAAAAIDLEQGVVITHAPPNQPRHQQTLGQQLQPGFLKSPPPGKGGGGVHSAANGNHGTGQQQPEQPHPQPQQAQPSSPPPPQGPQANPFGLEALVPECNAIGGFEKFGDRDVAFACDYCDGFLVWEDLDRMPSRTRNLELRLQHPSTANGGYGYYGGYPDWQAEALSVSTGEPKGVVFAPVAIANHLPPDNGDWRARVLCPYCDEYTYFDQGEEGGETKYAQDDRGLLGMTEFQEHLEWYHGAGLLPMPSMPTKKTNCTVM